MKVQDIHHVPLDNSGITAVREKPEVGGSGLSFARHLTTLSEAQFTAYVADLQERIRKQGERIKQRADLKALVEYRSLISELIGETASNAFAGYKSEVPDAKAGKSELRSAPSTRIGRADAKYSSSRTTCAYADGGRHPRPADRPVHVTQANHIPKQRAVS